MNAHSMPVLVAVILLQQLLIALAWGAAASATALRRPAWHWCGAALATAACMLLVTQRAQLDPWIGYGLANVIGIAAVVAIRRGTQIFCDTPTTDREHAALMLGAASALALIVWLGAARTWIFAVTSAAVAICLLRGAVESWRRLRFEFGVGVAWILVAPGALAGAAFALRVLLAPVLAGPGGPAATSPLVNVVYAIFMMASMLVLHFALGGMAVLRLVKRLQHLSWHDPLTGVLNRRGLEERMERELQRLRRHGQSFALLSIDIDHFKRINDQQGHVAGDEVLQVLASTLGAGLRDLDSLGRMGGEEFMAVLPHGDEAAGAVAARLCERVRQMPLPKGADGSTLAVTVSIGVAVATDRRETKPELLRRLDSALYRAKDEGRDRVVLAEPPLSALRLAAD